MDTFATTYVLLVEDNRRMAELIRTVLAGLGFAGLEHAVDDKTALKHLERRAFDLILLDRHLGGVDGLDVARRIRRSPARALSETPIIMLTGSASERSVRAARDAGVDGYLLKPFTVQGVEDRLATTLRQRRAFIRCETYIGPDRRRGPDAGYRGRERRSR